MKLDNPVPRVQYPDWLHKKMLAKTDKFKTRKITDMFSAKPKEVSEVDDGAEGNGGSAPVDVDIEDIGSEPRDVVIRPMAHTAKRKREDSPPPEAATWREALGPPPPFGTTKEERRAWIVFQKKKWMWQMERRGLRNRNKRGKTDNDVMLPKSTGPTHTLGGFIRRAQRTLLNTPWQIIQVAETGEPGLFRLWALVGSELHQVKLTVPRVFYVNRVSARAAERGPHWRRCGRVLPRARPAPHLYQYTVPEPLFRERQQELMSELSAPEIEGIYETQMSLEFRALVQLGCVCAVDPQEARSIIQFGSNNTDSFTLDQLQFKSVAHQPYLQSQDGVPALKHIFLYQHAAPGSARSMWALVLGPVRRGYIFALDSVRNNQVPNMSTLYAAERAAKINLGTEESALPSADMTWEVFAESEPRAVWRGVTRALARYRDERAGPTLLALQTALSAPALVHLMPGLAEFPLVPLHVRDVDALYGALDWQRVGARAIVRHYLNLDSVLNLTIEQCRYFHVPVGNMPADPTLFGADLFYARHLVKHNFVLWCSPLERPDLGGRETDDNRLVSEEEGGCVVEAPGAYAGVSVELSCDALAVCALLQAHAILQVEGTSVATSFGAQHANIQDVMATTGSNATATYDETAQCAAAFRVLRAMVAAWLRDVARYNNVFADFQISHFYRWLKSPRALLYEPALRRTLFALMKKLFLMLVAELKRLGARVVFADFNRIVLHTGKDSVAEGIGYVEFVVQSIRNKELFHGVELRYARCWTQLVWLDRANYAGIQGRLPQGLVEVGSSQAAPEDGDGDSEGAVSMHWNIANFLPAGVREYFLGAVGGYVAAAAARDRLPALLTGEMAQKLFQITEKINTRWPSLRAEDVSVRPGLRAGALSGSTPALLFVTALCRVLELDDSITDEVLAVRRQLLRLAGAGEWGEAAQWRDPSAPCRLGEVSCAVCNHCRDLDLAADPAHTSNAHDHPVLLCPSCGTAYENQVLEWRLIETMNRRTMSYTLQDLACARCHQVKRENLAVVCDCAGDFTLMVPLKEIQMQLETLKTIAQYYKMPLLLEQIEFNLSNI